MSNTNTGGPAFPMSGFDMRHGQPVQAVYQHGMNLRDWMAGMAMQGLVADGVGSLMDEELADWAYRLADAMLKAREA